MADSKSVGRSTLLKKGLKRLFDEGLLLSSYNIYSQFMPMPGSRDKAIPGSRGDARAAKWARTGGAKIAL
jgi:hypothetical protein